MDAVTNKRLIVSSTFIARGLLDASRFRNRANFDLALIRAAEHAFSLRDEPTVESVAAALITSSESPARAAGLFYLAWCDNRAGRTKEAQNTIAPLVNDHKAPSLYRTRALRLLALIKQREQDCDTAARLYRESAELSIAGSDHVSFSLSLLAAATLAADLEDFGQSLKLLREAAPVMQLVSRTHPHYKFMLLNNAAEALAHTGQIQEARRVIRHVLASPFARAYPEWLETAQEIEQQAREKAARNRTVRPAVEQARKTSIKPKLRLVKKPCPRALPAPTRRRIGPVTIIRPEPPRSRPILEQISFKVQIRAPSF
jgi:tetratricopeptide (TPR) repeat protein